MKVCEDSIRFSDYNHFHSFRVAIKAMWQYNTEYCDEAGLDDDEETELDEQYKNFQNGMADDQQKLIDKSGYVKGAGGNHKIGNYKEITKDLMEANRRLKQQLEDLLNKSGAKNILKLTKQKEELSELLRTAKCNEDELQKKVLNSKREFKELFNKLLKSSDSERGSDFFLTLNYNVRQLNQQYRIYTNDILALLDTKGSYVQLKHENGKDFYTGLVKDSILYGNNIELFDKNGYNIMSVTSHDMKSYPLDRLTGEMTLYHNENQPRLKCHLSNGKRHGNCKEKYPKGANKYELDYEGGKLDADRSEINWIQPREKVWYPTVFEELGLQIILEGYEKGPESAKNGDRDEDPIKYLNSLGGQ